jgi:hypothetical protein
MQAGDLAAVVVAIVSLAAVAMLTVATMSLLRTMRELRTVLDTLRDQTAPLIDDLRLTVDQAGADLERVEGILHSAERITSTVDSASQLTYRAISPPLIKTMSLVAGVRRAGRRLRGGPVSQRREVVEAAVVTDAVAHRRRARGRRSIEPSHTRKDRRR